MLILSIYCITHSTGGGSSFFSGVNNSFSGVEPCDGSLECCLDFHETAPYTATQRNLLSNSSMQQGMAIRWIGDPPVVVSTSPSPHPRTTLLNRSTAVLPSASGISVMPATNTNSSNKYLPTLNSGSGPFPSAMLRNSSQRSLHGQPQKGSAMGYSNSSTTTVSPHMSQSISRTGSIESASLDKRALHERLQAVAA